MDSGFAAFLGFLGGAFLMTSFLLIVVPNHKGECDSFGMTRMSGQVYVCTPKAK